MIWKGTHYQLQIFLKEINEQHPICLQNTKRIDCFSESKIYLDDNEIIQTTIYREEVDH